MAALDSEVCNQKYSVHIMYTVFLVADYKRPSPVRMLKLITSYAHSRFQDHHPTQKRMGFGQKVKWEKVPQYSLKMMIRRNPGREISNPLLLKHFWLDLQISQEGPPSP